MDASKFKRLSRWLERRVLLMIGRAVLTVVNDLTPLQTVQVEGLPGEIIDGAERFQLYGITSHPLPGADALVLAVGGIRQHPVILIDDRRHRVKELAEGEVCIYTHEDDPDNDNAHRVILKEGRVADILGDQINITADTRITLTVGDSSIVMTERKITLSAPDRVEVVQI